MVLTDPELDALMRELKRFATERNVPTATFRQLKGTQTTFTIVLGQDTYFGVDNLSSPHRVSITAYSREKPDRWRPDWDALVSRLQALFGQDRLAFGDD